MKVFKFGGASVNSVERIHNVANILQTYNNQQLIVIISAMGKTTNALEEVVNAFYINELEKALSLFEALKKDHINLAKELLPQNFNNCLLQLNDFFTEIEWLLHDKPVRGYDYYYDQVVCVGELLSTCIISHFLNSKGIDNNWIDVRDIIRTDNNFRDANVDWQSTTEKINQFISNSTITITQGFIGATDEMESTTLGREGSDYTAAIFANILKAESLTIWKDVEAVMSADPKQFPEATPLQSLSYDEVIEMAYYGAQVIHPKTIKPLYNAHIPLYVKSFINPALEGTIIHNKKNKALPPIIVFKNNQALMHLSSNDFSFVGEAPMIALYKILADLNIRPNLIQTGAISVQLCLDDKAEKLDALASRAGLLFNVHIEKDLSLLTIRHYTNEVFAMHSSNKKIILQQQTPETIQAIIIN